MRKLFSTIFCMFILGPVIHIAHCQTVQFGPVSFVSVTNGVVSLAQNQLPASVDIVGATVSNTGTLVLTVTVSTSVDNATWSTCAVFAVAGSATQTGNCSNQAGRYVQVSLSGVNNTIYGAVFGNNSAIGSVPLNLGLGYAQIGSPNIFTATQTAPEFDALSAYTINGVALASTMLSDTANLGYIDKANSYSQAQKAPTWNATSGYEINGVALASTMLSDSANLARVTGANTYVGNQNAPVFNAGTGFTVNGNPLASTNLADSGNIFRNSQSNTSNYTQYFASGGVSHSSIVEANGDLWILSNVYYDGTFFQRVNTAKTSYAIQLEGNTTYPGEADTAISVWYAAPGTGSICITFHQSGGCADYETTYGWQNGWTVQSFGTMVLGGNGFEFDGYGAVPYGRILHSSISNQQASLNGLWTGMLTNAFIDLSGTDSATNDSWFFGVINDAYYVLQAPATSGVPVFNVVSCTNNNGR